MNLVLYLLTFSIDFLFSVSPISALILLTFFLLFALDLICSCFLLSYDRLDYIIAFKSFFFSGIFDPPINFPLSTSSSVLDGLSDSSVGKEFTCNAGDLGWIPGRSTGEGIGYSLQYPWASSVAQQVKNLPTMWEIWVWSMDWEDLLEKGKATHSSVLAWRISWTV